MTTPLRDRLARHWARAISRRPRLVIAVGVILALLAVLLTVWRLDFIAHRNEMIGNDLEWNQRFEDWWESFPGTYDFIAVIDTRGPDGRPSPAARARAEAFVDELGPALNETEHIRRAEWGAPADDFSARTSRLLPMAQFEAVLKEAMQAEPLLEHPTPGGLIDAVTTGLARGGEDPEVDEQEIVAELTRLDELIEGMHRVLARPPDEAAGQHETSILQAHLAGPVSEDDWQYMASPNGRLLFVRITPRLTEDVLSAVADAIEAARGVMAEVQQRYPEVEAGLTGVEVVETDETEAIQADATLASILAFLLIATMLVLAYHNWQTPLLVMMALLIGIAWAFAHVVLSVGHLQLLSVFFIAILLGLGVDYGIHLAATYERVRRDFADGPAHFEPALARTLSLAGPGVLTGAVTTAAAFATIIFTDFSGVAEMGMIAFGGILLCLLAMFTIFPALLRMARHSHRHVMPPQTKRLDIYQERWSMPFVAHPWRTLIIAGLTVAVCIPIVMRIGFNYDLLDMQPRGLESVHWQQRIIEDGEQSIWFGVSISDDLDELRKRREAFLHKPTTGGVGGIGMLMPPDDEQKVARIDALPDSFRKAVEGVLAEADAAEQVTDDEEDAPSLDAEADGPAFDDAIGRLQMLLSAARERDDVPVVIAEAMSDLEQTVRRTTDLLRGLDDAEYERRLKVLQHEYRGFQLTTAHQLEALLDTSPLGKDDLPEALLRPYIDRTDPQRPRYALEVYPRLPELNAISSPLDPAFLPTFHRDLEAVDPGITGVVVQVYHFGELIRDSYTKAGIYAFLVVMALLWLSFRVLTDAVMCLLPVALGFCTSFAILVLAGESINVANITVLPLMFGIGVDAGVHMIHRFRQYPKEQPGGLTHGTGKGITLTSLTTMIGFSALMTASHGGIFSLGFIMTIGLALTMLTCWTVVPACLELRRRHRARLTASGGTVTGPSQE